MPNVLLNILTLLFCQSRFPAVNKTKSGRALSSLYEASACNQSLHLPTHRSLPPSPTSFNPFILLIHLPIYPSTHTQIQSIHASCCCLATFLNTLMFNFVCVCVCVFKVRSGQLLHYSERRPASYSSTSTQSHLGAAQYGHSRGLRAVLKGTLSPALVDGEIILLIHFHLRAFSRSRRGI